MEIDEQQILLEVGVEKRVKIQRHFCAISEQNLRTLFHYSSLLRSFSPKFESKFLPHKFLTNLLRLFSPQIKSQISHTLQSWEEQSDVVIMILRHFSTN